MVIGMGVLGNSVARTLAEEGGEVIALDKSPVIVDQIKDQVALAVEGDATDPKVLEQLGAADVDAAVVCIGEEFESAVLATANLLDIGVTHVAARAHSGVSATILKRVGAHDVFFVEATMGKVVAHRLRSPTVLHEMDLGGGYRIINWMAPDNMVGKSLSELALPKNFRVQVIAIRKESEDGVMETPVAQTVIGEGDLLLLSGYEKDLSGLLETWKTDD